MSNNIKDMLLNLKPKATPFHVTSWGVDVFIRALTEAERKELSTLDPDTAHDEVIKRTAIQAICDADGTQLFQDAAELDHLSFGGFSEIHGAVVRLTLGTFEGAKKN